MHFALTPEQELARSALRELLSEHCTAAHLRKVFEAAEPTRVPGLWAKLHQLGVIGTLASEAVGGIGLNTIDLAVLLEETGRAAVPEPLVETAFVAVPLLAALPDSLRAAQLLEQVLNGKACVSLALTETTPVPAAGIADIILCEHRGELHALDAVSSNALDAASSNTRDATSGNMRDAASGNMRDANSGNMRDANSGNMRGAASGNMRDAASGNMRDAASGNMRDATSGNMRDAASGNMRGAASGNMRDAASGNMRDATSGNTRDATSGNARDDAARNVLDATSGGVARVTLLESVDRARPLYRLAFDPSAATCIARGAFVAPLLAAARDHAALGTAAQLLGLGWRMLELTLAHVKTRKQFGQPVGAFQAVKHQLVDARLALEFAAPLVYRAAYSVAHQDPARSTHVSMAKAYASEAALLTARKALQLHGAIGYSYEYELHMYMKRAWALAAAYGDAREHRRRIADVVLTAQGESHA